LWRRFIGGKKLPGSKKGNLAFGGRPAAISDEKPKPSVLVGSSKSWWLAGKKRGHARGSRKKKNRLGGAYIDLRNA